MKSIIMQEYVNVEERCYWLFYLLSTVTKTSVSTSATDREVVWRSKVSLMRFTPALAEKLSRAERL